MDVLLKNYLATLKTYEFLYTSFSAKCDNKSVTLKRVKTKVFDVSLIYINMIEKFCYSYAE